MIRPINLNEKFDSFNETWTPKIVGDLNGQQVKIARLLGEFVRHKHENEDELFWVLEGVLKLVLDDQTIELHAGEMVVIPKGVYHQPIAEQEVKLVLFEPASTINTGDVSNEFTLRNLDHIGNKHA